MSNTTMKKKTYPKRSGPINTYAYYIYLKDYCDQMVKEGKFKKVDEDKAFGKYRDLTYELPNGNWAQLDVSSKEQDPRTPTIFREINPKTKEYRKNTQGEHVGTVKVMHIWDAMSYGLGIDPDHRFADGVFRNQLLPEMKRRYGEHPLKQKKINTEKIDEKSQEKLNNRRNLTEEEKRLDEMIRTTMFKSMTDKMVQSIQETGTLFGKEPMDMPIWIHSNDISHMVKPGEWDKDWSLRDQGKFPGNAGDFNEVVETVNGITKVTNREMKGLLYIAAMQDSHTDKRYMELNDMISGTRNRDNGQKMRNGPNGIWTPNYIYGGDFGFKKQEGKQEPELKPQKCYTNSKKMFWGFTVDPVQAKDYLMPAVWVDHTPYDHLTTKSFVNVEDIALRPVNSKPNEHDQDTFINPRHPKNGTREAIIQKFIDKYGKSIENIEAFKKNPIQESRRIVETKTENRKIKFEPMRIFQRELTLDKMWRGCGKRDGIEIEAKDRGTISKYLRDAFLNENKKEWGKRLLMATIAMDRNNDALRGMTEERRAELMKEIRERPKFQDVSIEFKSDYTTRAGAKIPRGAGGPYSIDIKGEDAYKLLSDMCVKDKQLFEKAGTPDYGKSVKFDLTVGNKKFENITLIMGKLETGNEDTVADSMINVLSRNARNSAYRDETSKKEFNEIQALKESGFLKKDMQALDETDYAKEKLAAYQHLEMSLQQTFSEFRTDEANYLDAQRVAGHPFGNDLSQFTADVYRYEIPERNKSRLYQALETNDIVRIQEPDKRLANLPNSLVVELRRPLDPVLGETQDGKIVNVKNEQGKATFEDRRVRKQPYTQPLEAIPYLNQEELEKVGPFEKKFSLDITVLDEQGEKQTKSYEGEKARNMFLQLANRDKDAFDDEKKGLRSIRHADPITVAARWEHEPIFEKEARVGSKAFSNGHSLEEIISSQKESLSEKGKEALVAMLSADRIHEKYSPNRDWNNWLSKAEVLEKEEIDKIINAPKKVKEYQNAENLELEGVTQIERLQTEALVNGKETDQAIMNHIVDGMLKETNLRGKAAVKAMQESLQKELPGMEEAFKKSIERKEVQRKLASTRGIKRRPSSKEQGRP